MLILMKSVYNRSNIRDRVATVANINAHLNIVLVGYMLNFIVDVVSMDVDSLNF